MEGVESLVKTTLGEIEKVLSSKTVVGEPITVEGATLIPLISIGFGFGAGSGTGPVPAGGGKGKLGEGTGGGSGGGGGVKPVAVVIVTKEGVRIESIKGSFAAAIEKMAETFPKMMETFMEKRGEKKEG
ncbi:hypothetical protein ES703_94369 [subsurface metagenome]